MTDDATRREKADLLLEHKETGDHLRVLRDKGIATFSALGEAKEIFYSRAGIGHYQGTVGKVFSDKHRDAFNYEAVAQLLAEIEKCSAKLKKLTERKAALNL